ncbi:transmembrane protein, putative (macronuclear) [Tetrahymena thermophila SB210]|uniref:Transmembrane protein, putative n=1 Tax=Tetrahymena thermophila (strain SB210) TaxID=312017 RepID=Q237G9_TETTS|nr:transmembrane protein, putative [Tetrahymena thermophila SB210]EAR92772.1 transmembrane protein, putative [Tetrahymena thermophila SB210]|eukprot:XP_001013017.1 transmembrane protein, putative [Tetrahymena thermophila SB210]
MNNNNQNYQYQNLQDQQYNNNSYNPQQHQLGQPFIYNQNNNYNEYGYQYPQQQVGINQNNNQQNPAFVINTDPNLINIQYSSPEIIYCTAPIRSRRKYGNQGVGVSGIVNALQQIYSELNLIIPNLNLIGQFNLLSNQQMENKVLQQIINNNRGFQNEIIRNSKIFYCCKSLQSSIKKYFYYLLILYCVSLAILSIGYPIYLQDSDSQSDLVTPFAIQITLLAVQILILLISILKTLPKLIKLNLLLGILNFAYSFIITVVSGFVEFNHGFNSNAGLRFGIQIPCIILLSFSLLFSGALIAGVRRFLILVKQLDQIEFTNNSCI